MPYEVSGTVNCMAHFFLLLLAENYECLHQRVKKGLPRQLLGQQSGEKGQLLFLLICIWNYCRNMSQKWCGTDGSRLFDVEYLFEYSARFASHAEFWDRKKLRPADNWDFHAAQELILQRSSDSLFLDSARTKNPGQYELGESGRWSRCVLKSGLVRSTASSFVSANRWGSSIFDES
jgi:hypothetical protein